MWSGVDGGFKVVMVGLGLSLSLGLLYLRLFVGVIGRKLVMEWC